LRTWRLTPVLQLILNCLRRLQKRLTCRRNLVRGQTLRPLLRLWDRRPLLIWNATRLIHGRTLTRHVRLRERIGIIRLIVWLRGPGRWLAGLRANISLDRIRWPHDWRLLILGLWLLWRCRSFLAEKYAFEEVRLLGGFRGVRHRLCKSGLSVARLPIAGRASVGHHTRLGFRNDHLVDVHDRHLLAALFIEQS
jgi:hypothetical protein